MDRAPRTKHASSLSTRIGALLFAAAFIGAVAACELANDVSPLTNGSCPDKEKGCSVSSVQQCVSALDPAFGCGEEKNCLPCDVKVVNAVTTCDLQSQCAIASCKGGFRDCNHGPLDGCEINSDTDANNCRECGHACPAVPHATPLCLGGTCGFVCTSGFGDCNVTASDGCETDLSTDPKNCKQCTTACGAGQTCVAGSCT